MAVNMVGGRGDECKRERGHGSFAGDETFLFWESVLSRYCQFYVVYCQFLKRPVWAKVLEQINVFIVQK